MWYLILCSIENVNFLMLWPVCVCSRTADMLQYVVSIVHLSIVNMKLLIVVLWSRGLLDKSLLMDQFFSKQMLVCSWFITWLLFCVFYSFFSKVLSLSSYFKDNAQNVWLYKCLGLYIFKIVPYFTSIFLGVYFFFVSVRRKSSVLLMASVSLNHPCCCFFLKFFQWTYISYKQGFDALCKNKNDLITLKMVLLLVFIDSRNGSSNSYILHGPLL